MMLFSSSLVVERPENAAKQFQLHILWRKRYFIIFCDIFLTFFWIFSRIVVGFHWISFRLMSCTFKDKGKK